MRTVLALGALSTAVACAQIAAIQLRREEIVDLPVGRAAIPPAGRYGEIFRWMAENTKPGQWYFGLPPVALPLELRNPTPLESVGSGEYCRPEQVTAVVESLEKNTVPIMILQPPMYSPVTEAHTADHLQPFRDYLFRHYRKTKTFASGFEAWQRVDR